MAILEAGRTVAPVQRALLLLTKSVRLPAERPLLLNVLCDAFTELQSQVQHCSEGQCLGTLG